MWVFLVFFFLFAIFFPFFWGGGGCFVFFYFVVVLFLDRFFGGIFLIFRKQAFRQLVSFDEIKCK